MGLENLKSVFSNLSKNPSDGQNPILPKSKFGPAASALDDIEDNLIGDPNPRVGMLHGILTEGDQYVFELPEPPDTKPLTGRDTSDYNDILKHSTIDPKSGLHSPVSDLSEDPDSFGQHASFTKIDSIFANKSLRLRGGESLIDTEIKHTFGFSVFDDLIKIPPSGDRQTVGSGAYTALSNKDDSIVFNSFIDAERIGPQSGYSGGVSADNNNPTAISIGTKQKRAEDLFQQLGQNNRLGSGKFILESLYNTDHTPVAEADRHPIEIKPNSVHGGYKIHITRAGMGALENLNIMGYTSRLLDNFRGFDRGKEPYIVQDIGSVEYSTGVDREKLPFTRIQDDNSRLIEFYNTDAGKWYIAKENITNMLIGNSIQKFRTDTILIPPFLNPLQGNTGFLNFTNTFVQGLGNRFGSLRKPTTIEYSKRASMGLPFMKLGDRTETVLGFEIEKPMVKPSSFFDLSGAPQNIVGGRGLFGYRNTKYVDKLYEYDAVVGISKDDEPPPLEAANLIKKGDFYVRFKDMRNNKFIYFRGFVTGITENVNPSYGNTNYIGRTEAVYKYMSTERDMSFNLRLYPFDKNEFKKMWEKIEYLTGLCYPRYTGYPLLRMQGPFTELYMGHIGTKAQGQFGFIKSLSYTINDTGDWDAETNLPRLIDVSISYQILSKKSPNAGVESIINAGTDKEDIVMEEGTPFYPARNALP